MFKNLSDTKKVEIYNDKDMHNKKVKLFVSFDNNNKIVEFNTCLFNDEIMFEKAIKRLEEINISFSFYENKKKPAYLHYQYINKINTDFNEYFKIEMKNEWYLESYKESLDIKRMQLQETYEFSVIGLLVDIRNNIDSYDFRSVFLS